eukprot:UN09426
MDTYSHIWYLPDDLCIIIMEYNPNISPCFVLTVQYRKFLLFQLVKNISTRYYNDNRDVYKSDEREFELFDIMGVTWVILMFLFNLSSDDVQ